MDGRVTLENRFSIAHGVVTNGSWPQQAGKCRGIGGLSGGDLKEEGEPEVDIRLGAERETSHHPFCAEAYACAMPASLSDALCGHHDSASTPGGVGGDSSFGVSRISGRSLSSSSLDYSAGSPKRR
jgi:hypothetical protein